MADITTVAQTYDNAGAAIVLSRAPANNFKTVQRTQIGTRELSVIKVLVGGTNASMILADGQTADVGGVLGHTLSNSLFSVAVRSLQAFGEVYAVYTPVATGFIAIVATDTLNSSESGNGTNPLATTFGLAEANIKAAIDAAKLEVTKDTTVGISLPTVAIGVTL